MSEGALDYVVVKPARYDFGDGEVMLEHGTIIPGEIAETWGNGLMHLCNLGRLAPTPKVADDHPRLYDVAAPPPVIEADAGGAEATVSIDDVLAHADEVAALQSELDAKDDEIASLREQLEQAGATSEVEDDEPEILDWDSEEYLARFDAVDASEVVAEISTWGTGDGSEESAAVLKPPAEIITSLRDHEVAAGNRQEVVDALDAQLAEPATDGAVVEESAPAEVFPQHKAAGVFILSDGSEVKGKKAAIEAQAALDAAATAASEA